MLRHENVFQTPNVIYFVSANSPSKQQGGCHIVIGAMGSVDRVIALGGGKKPETGIIYGVISFAQIVCWLFPHALYLPTLRKTFINAGFILPFARSLYLNVLYVDASLRSIGEFHPTAPQSAKFVRPCLRRRVVIEHEIGWSHAQFKTYRYTDGSIRDASSWTSFLGSRNMLFLMKSFDRQECVTKCFY